MSELMRENGPRTNISRRWFIQGAVAAVGAAGFAFGQGKTSRNVDGKPVIPDGPAVADCGCINEAALPLTAAAAVGGKYFGLAGTDTGPAIYELNVDARRQISLGSPVKLDLPVGFVFGSIGAARGGLIVSGGVPFVVETLDVDYELTEDVRTAMDGDIPEGIPTSGRKKVEIMGVRPAAFIINGRSVEPLLLPEMPKRSFAVATAVTESASGGAALLIEHSDGVNESFYASAIDVVEENGRDWNVWNAGRNLGESGPNYIATDREGIFVGVNTGDGAFLVNPESGSFAVSTASNRILTLVPGDGDVTALVQDRTGQHTWSSISSEGRLISGASAEIPGDELIGATAISGAKGQVILLGRRTTVLVDNIPAFVSRAKGGDRHVM